MKYIRGKEGIYELSKFGYAYPRNYKKADTIEQLCDEFVWENCLIKFINKEKTKFILKQANAQYEEEYDIEEDFDECSIYGAIWTTGEHGEPILKSVAKMNDKGELELL